MIYNNFSKDFQIFINDKIDYHEIQKFIFDKFIIKIEDISSNSYADYYTITDFFYFGYKMSIDFFINRKDKIDNSFLNKFILSRELSIKFNTSIITTFEGNLAKYSNFCMFDNKGYCYEVFEEANPTEYLIKKGYKSDDIKNGFIGIIIIEGLMKKISFNENKNL